VADEKAEWFIPGRDRKPVGPYTTEQVLRALRIGRIKPQTVCWREGMAEWLPIEQVPALAHLLQPAQMQRGLTRFQCSCGNEIVMSAKFAGKQAKCSGCGAVVTVPAAVPEAPVPVAKPKRSFVSQLVVLLLLAGLGAGAYYFVVADYLKLRKAEEFIKKESYRKASKELRGPDKSFLFKNQALYLEGLIEVYEFASQEGPHEISVSQILQGENPLSGTQRSLKKACKAEPKCKELAKDDLAEAIEKIPAESNDRLARILAINLLRNELDAADKKLLAQEVIEALRGKIEFQQRFDEHKSLVMLLLEWDSSRMTDLFTTLLPEDAAVSLFYSRNLRLLYQWAQEKPELQNAFPDAILTCVKMQLESDQPQDAVGILESSMGYLPEEKKADAADLYWQAAKLLKESNPNMARKAFAFALKIKPDVAHTESDLLLSIELSPNADEKKLVQYKLFLDKYPESNERANVLSMLVDDAIVVGNQQGFYRRTPIALYLDAALAAARELLAQFAATPDLDSKIHNLARAFQKNKRQGEALNLSKTILEKIPNTPLKSDIENEIQQWEQGPSQITPTTTNKVPSNNAYAPVPPAPTSTTPSPTTTSPTTISPTTPPTSTTPPAPKKDEPTLVKSADELEEALKNPDIQKVMWVRLAGRNITPDQKRRLQFWVANGGVLWLETDLVKTFRFPNLKSIPRNLTQGRARVYQDKHSVLQGIGGTQVPFEVEPGQVGIAMQGRFSPPKGIIPLMVIETAQNEYTAIAALKTYQKGYVILRPAKIQTDTQPGQKFDQNLRNFSFNLPQKTTPGYRPVP
jgi:uncharacterized protein DUF4339